MSIGKRLSALKYNIEYRCASPKDKRLMRQEAEYQDNMDTMLEVTNRRDYYNE